MTECNICSTFPAAVDWISKEPWKRYQVIASEVLQPVTISLRIVEVIFILEIRSVERGICPIATLALHLTLYSLTGSRFDP